MNSISNITNKIIADAEAEAKQIREEAEKASSDILSDYMRKAEEESAAIIADAEKEAESVMSTAMARIDMDKRMEMLACRRKLIDDVFKKAFKGIESLPEDEYIAFLRNMLAAADCQDGEIILNDRDQVLYEKIVEGLRPGITLSEKKGAQKGGFIIVSGETEINCTFEVVFKAAEEDLQNDVVSILFKQND